MKKLITLAFLLINLSLAFNALAQPTLQAAVKFGDIGEDRARRMISDAAGNMFLVGYFADTVDFNPGAGVDTLMEWEGRDAYILKLDANGNFLWVKGIHGTATDMITDIALDDTGNIYVTGFFQGLTDFDPHPTGAYLKTSVGGLDAFVAKYDAGGNFVWANCFGSTDYENGSCIEVDPAGNVVCCGYFNSTVDFDPSPSVAANLTSAGFNDAFIAKYTPNGNLKWAKRIGGSSGIDMALGLVCDASNNIYTCGEYTGSVDFDPGTGTAYLTNVGSQDAFILKLDTAGNYKWAIKFGSINADYANDIRLDAAKNIYTTGYFANTADFNPAAGTSNVYNLVSAGLKDAFFSKLDSNGAFVWAKSIGSTADDEGYRVFVKPTGEILYSGYMKGTVDMDPGTPQYLVTPSGTPVSHDIFGLKLDAAGNFVFGLGIGGTGMDLGFDILEDANGGVYMTGCFYYTADFDCGPLTYPLTSAGNLDIFLAKYNANVFVGQNEIADNNKNEILIYPNPASDQITLQVQTELLGSNYMLSDMLGRTVLTGMIYAELSVIDTKDLPAGVYLFTLDGQYPQIYKVVKK